MKNNSILLVFAVLVSLFLGGLAGYYLGFSQQVPRNYLQDASVMMKNNGSGMMQMSGMMMVNGQMMESEGQKNNDTNMMQRGREMQGNGSMMRERGEDMMKKGDDMIKMMEK